jgi:hypothetical protein
MYVAHPVSLSKLLLSLAVVQFENCSKTAMASSRRPRAFTSGSRDLPATAALRESLRSA